MDQRKKRTTRDIVLDMLQHWGDWERVGESAAMGQRSPLGRLIVDGPATGGGGTARSLVPVGVMIPTDVTEMAAMLDEMRTECRAGERYYQAIRARYIVEPNIRDQLRHQRLCPGCLSQALRSVDVPVNRNHLNRAITALENIFAQGGCQSEKTKYAVR